MSEALVSIILPTLNRSNLLAVSIGSVLAQSFWDFELIVVDDGSTEDIEAAIERFGDNRIRCVRRETNGGPAAARNTGIANARGQYVAFQDSDDEWMLDKLHHQVAVLESGEAGVMCIGSLVRRFGDNVRLFCPKPDNEQGQLSIEQVMSDPIAYTQTWLVPRYALEQVGGFDEQLAIWEDWDLLLRLVNIVQIRTAPGSLVYSERLADSITNDAPKFIDSMDLLLEKHKELLSPHNKVWARLHYMRARRLMNLGRWGRARQDLKISLTGNAIQWRAWVALLAISLRLKVVMNAITGDSGIAGKGLRK
jgi:glycosyltransferase involved in cell wall biosynthesis